MNKIIDFHTLIEINKTKKNIGFTNGCFDIIHLGHLDYLSKCKNFVDILIVGVNSDSSVKKLKGIKRPINSLNDRMKFLSYFQFVDYIISFNDDTPYNLIKLIKPNFLFKGGDYTNSNVVGADIVEDSGGQVKIIPFLNGYSSSSIINKIEKK